MNSIIIFDLDGVITGEDAYWITAGLVVHELLYSPRYWNPGATSYQPPIGRDECDRVSHEVLPEAVIQSFKAHSVNSNWDTCYAAACMCFIDLLATLPDPASLAPLRPWDEQWNARFRHALAQRTVPSVASAASYQRFDDPHFAGYVGLELFDRLNTYASALLGFPVEGVFARYSPSWEFCRNLFQEWYLGDDLYEQEYGHAPAQTGKQGCIYFERPLLSVEALSTALAELRAQGYTLGVATGRPGQEAILPLQKYGLYQYFDAAHVITDREVVQMETTLRERGEYVSLVKPNPYPFLAAALPGYRPGDPVAPRGSFVVVGDTPSDVRGGHAAGALTVAVLSGARTAEARAILEQTQPDFLVPDITHVPALLARFDDLETIRRLQFTERAKAELLLQRWFARYMDLSTESVTLTPKAVSLNSFNGVYRVGGEEYFFKTHVEDQGVVEEYYHAELLYNAGYNIVRPLRTVHEKGQQMVIYPVIHSPVMFDLMRAVETGHEEQADVAMLAAAEKHECERLFAIYGQTLAASSAAEHARAPIHQLFWHRLAGERLKHFYAGQFIPYPEGQAQDDGASGLTFEELLDCRWTINGQDFAGDGSTLRALIERAQVVLNPARAAMTVIGHGDAHFGNVFLEEQTTYRYFDPAFAGRHSPVLDIVKPFFHNVYATWMYFPQEVAGDLHIAVTRRGSCMVVEHNYALTPVRQAILETKIKHLLRPLIASLRAREALADDWVALMQSALLCCPLLTVNLLDHDKRSAAICWLGLSQVIQMGHFELEALVRGV